MSTITAPGPREATTAPGRARRRSGRRAFVLAAVLTALVAGAGFAAGSLAIAGAAVPGTPGVAAGIDGATDFDDLLVAVAARNLPVAATLAAGIVSFGVLSAVSTLLLGLYLGATMTAAANTVGVGTLFADVAGYAVIEMLGLALAAIAGFLPIATMLVGARHRAGFRRSAFGRYLDGIRLAAWPLGAGVVLLAVGALVEAAVITVR